MHSPTPWKLSGAEPDPTPDVTDADGVLILAWDVAPSLDDTEHIVNCVNACAEKGPIRNLLDLIPTELELMYDSEHGTDGKYCGDGITTELCRYCTLKNAYEAAMAALNKEHKDG